MPKKEFQAQRYYLKWLCAFPLIAVALLIEFIIAQYTDSDIIFYLSCVIVMSGLLSIYYLAVDKLHLFQCKGYYWEKEDFLVVEIGKHKYEINDVKTLIGEEPSIFFYKYAYMLIETPKEKIKIFGQTLHGDMKFSNSDLYPLFQIILEKNQELKPKKILKTEVEGWYEK